MLAGFLLVISLHQQEVPFGMRSFAPALKKGRGWSVIWINCGRTGLGLRNNHIAVGDIDPKP
jgi:hypothetical protein